ncbi:uncharacterized protein LOC119197070 isoform X1 [Pungitius pungitius]|uniref:uncharacterized protein LOC119197070 isoform X1 n=1 Tax=Pungitius pungitius TaxID=134920 RepID=UPI002E0D30A9
MDLLKSQTLHPHLRGEEALVVENAIRLAIDSIINVLYGVNSSRTREYQRMVADKDKEIRRLESSLSEMECEVKVLRRRGFACGLLGGERSPVGSRTPDDAQTIEESGFELSCINAERTAEHQDYEMSINLGLFAKPPSQVSPQIHLSAPTSSRARADRSCIPLSSNSSDVSEAVGNLPMSPGGFVIKEEPCDIDPVLIKLEMSDERFEELREGAGHPCEDNEGASAHENVENSRTLDEDRHAEPGGYGHHDVHLRNKKKGVPMSELTEEAQRQKRAAWRAASRRYYARKVARQQAHPPRSGPAPSHPTPSFLQRSGPAPSRLGPFFPRSAPVPHVTDSRYPHPISFADKRRRTLISELPEASQSLQREAWRAASKRYYARKNPRHHAEPMHYAHLLQDAETPGDAPEPNRAGPHAASGGIMCS